MDSPLPSKRLITGSDPYLALAGCRDSLWMSAQHLESPAKVGQIRGRGVILHHWDHFLVLLSGPAVLRGAALRQPEGAFLPQLLLDVLLDADGSLRARMLACSRPAALQAQCSAECMGTTSVFQSALSLSLVWMSPSCSTLLHSAPQGNMLPQLLLLRLCTMLTGTTAAKM